MSDKIIQFDDAMFESKLDALVRVKVEQTINAMLDAEADEIANAVHQGRNPKMRKNSDVIPRARPEADRDVRLADAVRPVAEFHPDTVRGSGNCKAEVNGEVISMPPNYPNVLTSDHPSPTLNSERPRLSLLIILLSSSTEEKATVYLVDPSFS